MVSAIQYKETNEIEEIQRLKPLRLNNQKYFENYEYIEKEKYQIINSKKTIIVEEGKLIKHSRRIISQDKAIRGIKILFGEEYPKQINFKERSFPIGEGNRWYDIELKKKESIESAMLEFSFIAKEKDNIEIEEIELYGEESYEFKTFTSGSE